MRRLIALSMLLAAVSVAAGCTSSPTSTASGGSTAGTGSGGGGTSVSSAAVCAKLRTVVSNDIGPIGTAFGTIVGDATAKNSSGQQKAESDATDAITKLAGDLSAAAAAGNDPAVRTAATKAERNIKALTDDPSFLSDISSMDDIATATSKLQAATAPITTACQGA